MASILKVDTIQDQSGNNIINENADTITIGASGDTIAIPTGATLTVPNGKITGQNYPAFEAFLSSNQTVTDNATTKIQFNSEVFDTDSCYDNSVNYRFTPTVAGKYFVYAVLGSDTVSGANLDQLNLFVYKNGSEISQSKIDARGNTLGSFCTVNATLTVDMNGSSDYLEAFGQIDDTSGNPDFLGTTPSRKTLFGAYRIGA